MAVIYQVICGECGQELNIENVWLDAGDDLEVVVEPCETCIEKAKQEIREELAEEEG